MTCLFCRIIRTTNRHYIDMTEIVRFERLWSLNHKGSMKFLSFLRYAPAFGVVRPVFTLPFILLFVSCLIILSTQKWCQYSRKLAPCWTSEQTWRFFWSVPLASLEKSWVGAAPVTGRFLFVTEDFQATSKNRSRMANWFTWVNKIIKALHRVGLTIT